MEAGMPWWHAKAPLRQLRQCANLTSRSGPRLRRLQRLPGSPETGGLARRTARWTTSGQAQHPETPARQPPSTHGTGARGWASQETLLPHLERLTRLYRNVQISYRVMGISSAVAVMGVGYLVINWGMVRTGVSRESAEVISETIRDERIQFSAQEFSKELLNQLLHDDEIAKTVAKWVYQLLASLQDDIGALFVRILQQERVVEAVMRLADRLVAYLCSSQSIQEKVGGLLVDAICLEASRDGAAKWAYELVMREDVTCGFRDLVVAALQMDAVVHEAKALARHVLQDPDLVSEAKRAIDETLRDAELRATAKESLWNIVLPWSSNRLPDKKRALKLLDELAIMDSLTQEERQVLRSLQSRIKAGVAPATGSNGAVAGGEPSIPSAASIVAVPEPPSPPAFAAASPATRTGAPEAGTLHTAVDSRNSAGRLAGDGTLLHAATEPPKPQVVEEAADAAKPPVSESARPEAAPPVPIVDQPVTIAAPPGSECATARGLQPTAVLGAASGKGRQTDVAPLHIAAPAPPAAAPCLEPPGAPPEVPAEVAPMVHVDETPPVAPAEVPAKAPSERLAIAPVEVRAKPVDSTEPAETPIEAPSRVPATAPVEGTAVVAAPASPAAPGTPPTPSEPAVLVGPATVPGGARAPWTTEALAVRPAAPEQPQLAPAGAEGEPLKPDLLAAQAAPPMTRWPQVASECDTEEPWPP